MKDIKEKATIKVASLNKTNKNKSMITSDVFDKMVQQVQAAASLPEYYCYFTLRQVQSIPEYFYQDICGQWWFDTPWTCRQKVVILPEEALGDKCLLIKKEDIDNSIWRIFKDEL